MVPASFMGIRQRNISLLFFFRQLFLIDILLLLCSDELLVRFIFVQLGSCVVFFMLEVEDFEVLGF